LTAALVAAAGYPAFSAEPVPRIALIIDDIGYRWDEGQRAVRLPGAVAIAVLPHATYSIKLARAANDGGKEVVLHLPMQAIDAGEDPGPGALELDQTRGEFAAAFAADLAAVPFVRAVNNHMGSLLTRHPGHMRWLMEELRAHGGLFFVDSYTTPQSVGLMVARENGVPALRRDVFLDTELSAEGIAAEWQRLLQLARKRGSAIGIGHPHPATLALLERALPQLSAEGVELVTLTTLLSANMAQ
jgi:polysaccharide deacetylase 2 family uncharacterized protein YibQ